MSDIPDSPGSSPPASSRGILWAIPAVLLATLGLTYLLRVEADGGLEVGKPMPEIVAEGWLNGTGPTMAELKGKVLVIDAWAHWCGPCAREAPNLVRAHETYKDKVQFIGLTGEGKDSRDKSAAFLKRTHITWPNGYGAAKTLAEFKASVIPLVWVVGVDGTIVWNFGSNGTIEDGIELALQQARIAALNSANEL